MTSEQEDEFIEQGVRECAATIAGRAFLFHLLDICAIYAPTIPNEMLEFNVGRKSVGIDLIGIMNEVDPLIYPKLLLERAENDTRDED